MTALQNAVVLVTEWRAYRELDPDETGRLVRQTTPNPAAAPR